MVCTLENHRAEVRELLAAAFDSIDTGPTQLLPLSSESLPGRALARAMHARLPIPSFTNSQMDGFAVCAADLAEASTSHPVTLPLGYTAAAGGAQVIHQPGTATPVMTGAEIPAGADSVVPVEDTDPGVFTDLVRPGEGTPNGSVSFSSPSAAGRFIRPIGDQLPAGTLLAEAGTRLTPALIGALAASGIHEVPVRRAPRILLCTTGDELAAPGEHLHSGRIPDANSPMLAALLRGYGAQVSTARLPDDPQGFTTHLHKHAGRVDLVLTIGGISAGAFEVVRQGLEPFGGTFHHVALQPGGPQGFAELNSSRGPTLPVLCFPGNPVSAYLSAELFLAPLLRSLAGLPEPVSRSAVLAGEVHSPEHKHQVRRAVFEHGRVRVLDPGSHLIHDLANADALVHIPVGVSHLPAGSRIDTWSLNV
ncbi:molybdopterin molybdotransferase MoeA [Glutamicibacter endophyticus]